jgi:hypothetical protein
MIFPAMTLPVTSKVVPTVALLFTVMPLTVELPLVVSVDPINEVPALPTIAAFTEFE